MQVSLEHATHVSSNPVTLPLSWPTPRNLRTRRALATIHQRLQAMLDERRREGASSGNLLSMMLAHRDEAGRGLSDAQLRDHAVTLFAAGHETAALLLSWTWYLLLRHPEHYAAVQREVDEVLGGREPSFEDLPRLGFTLQVIKEALRLFPPGVRFELLPVQEVRPVAGLTLGPSPYRVRVHRREALARLAG